ncbi:MAG: TetR/AcrR family transcriptional regulator [Promethearchaeota archaeon]|jgi:AcrR family transcriptional regulator
MNADPKKKQTRSRSPEKKAAQFERILETGKQLFSEKGTEGFSLRSVAKTLGMNQNNIYNYVESKKELYIAIRNKFFTQLRDENRVIIKNHKGTTVDLLLKIIENFLNFATDDMAAFTMMHLQPAPSSNKIGPFERDYRPFNFLDGTIRIVQKAIDESEIKDTDATALAFYIYSVILGAAIVERNLRVLGEQNNNNADLSSEYFDYKKPELPLAKFRSYLLTIIERVLI